MIEYNKNKPLRLFEICAGYGSQALALKRLQNKYPEFRFELTGWCEFDVVSCLYHIFRKMFINTDIEKKQLELF